MFSWGTARSGGEAATRLWAQCVLLPGTGTEHSMAGLRGLRCQPKQHRRQSVLVRGQRRLPDHTQEGLVWAGLKAEQELCKQQSRCQVLVPPSLFNLLSAIGVNTFFQPQS